MTKVQGAVQRSPFLTEKEPSKYEKNTYNDSRGYLKSHRVSSIRASIETS